VSRHSLLTDIETLAAVNSDREEFLLKSAQAINRHFPHYNWIGFYFLKDGKLHVGPYIGKPTPHTVIDLDRGICGAAFSQGETIIVDDVNADPRFLACSLETRSEIVVPIRAGGELIGELDIDSDKKSAFGDDDKILMEQVAILIGEILGRY
jgi:L-methionine (R)-S-oxide reductase